jgi:hypothetical protein
MIMSLMMEFWELNLNTTSFKTNISGELELELVTSG